jgi:hypothetical protein
MLIPLSTFVRTALLASLFVAIVSALVACRAADAPRPIHPLILIGVDGTEFSVDVLTEGAKKPLMVAGAPLRGAIRSLNRLSGTHGRKTPGIFIAAGPDIDRQTGAEGLRVIDVPPTVLYAIGLPVADDFAGRARTEIFTEDFRSLHPLQTIPTWGERDADGGRSSAVDEELVDRLRALGYLD